MYIYMLYVYILYIYILSICLQKLSICIYTSFFKFHIHCLYSVYIQFHIDCIYRYRHVYVDGTKTCLYSVYMTYRQFQLLVYIAPLLYRRKNVYIIQTYRLQTLKNNKKNINIFGRMTDDGGGGVMNKKPPPKRKTPPKNPPHFWTKILIFFKS